MSVLVAPPADVDTASAAGPRTVPGGRTPGAAAAAPGAGPSANPARNPSARPARRPQLLLPPLSEPAATALPGTIATLPQVRSVLAPVTEAAWAAAARRGAPEQLAELPDPARLCGAVVVAAVEALRSTRPLVQLARWVSPAVYESLARAARPTPGQAPRGVVVRGLRVCRISPVVAEGTAVVHDGERVRAAAVRFEVHRGSWRATVLQIG